MKLLSILLAIFAAPFMQVIGFFIVICIVAWALWWLLTTVIIPPAPAPPRPFKNLGYIIYVIVVALMFIWWVSFAFGLGIFN